MRVALVHDWLTGMRGGEKVLEILCELHPDADIFTLVHEPGSVSPRIERHRIIASSLQRVPWVRRHYRHCLPLFPILVEQFALEGYDLVISSSHCVAKAAIPGRGARHLSYSHSPMRYAWDQFDAYFGPDRVGLMASRWFYRPILQRMAKWDAATSTRVDRFLSNSRHVAGRIRRYYNRSSTIVYPPVDTVFFHPDETASPDCFVVVSALVPYKRIDLAVEACTRLGARLRIVGEGPERRRLERRAGPTIEFLGHMNDEGVRREYRRAVAVLLPGEEDFGIAPVEAQACGRPVVALARGGALETIINDETGIVFEEPTVDSLMTAIQRVSRMRVDTGRIRRHAEQFSRERHLEQMRGVIEETVSAPAGTRW